MRVFESIPPITQSHTHSTHATHPSFYDTQSTSCRLPGRDIFNERAGAPAANSTKGTDDGKAKPPPPPPKKGRTLAAGYTKQQQQRSSSFSSFPFPAFTLGLLVGTLGALSLVFGLRQMNGGGGGSRYRYASRFEGGGRHHVLP